MDSKSLRGVEIKDADKGEVSAVFATLNVIDKDGDVSTADTFQDGEEVLISAYGHKSWDGALPVGEGRIRITASEAILDGKFFLDTTAGRDTFQVVKRLGAKQEWSYGFDILDAEPGKFDGQDVQFLKRVKVHEASPVLLGAGVNTRTLSAKSAKSAIEEIERGRVVSEYKAAVRPHETPTSTKAWSAAKAEDQLLVQPSIMDLRSMYAWCDPSGDPEMKTSYRYPHHDGPAGDANLRACVAGIAKLNGSAPGVPEEDRRGVYNHLAAHLVDSDRVPAELRSSTGGALKFTEEAAAVLSAVDGLLERGSEVMALRRSKGKALAADSVELLEWVFDAMKAFRVLLDTPQEDAAREYARYVQSLLQSNPTTQGEQ
jgi:hypothetical protein